jgi:ubiquinone/menaquinone biosynthesis C-methylase UbiE
MTAHATGIGLTPAKIEQATLLPQEKKLNNMTWEVGNVTQLPYDDASFFLVLARNSFHQPVDTISVLSEIKRVA